MGGALLDGGKSDWMRRRIRPAQDAVGPLFPVSDNLFLSGRNQMQRTGQERAIGFEADHLKI